MPDTRPFSPLFPGSPGSPATPFHRESSAIELAIPHSHHSHGPTARAESLTSAPRSDSSRSPHNKPIKSGVDDIHQLLWSDSEPLITTTTTTTTMTTTTTTSTNDMVPVETAQALPNRMKTRRRVSPPEMCQRNSSVHSTPRSLSPFRTKQLVSPPESLLRRTSSIDSTGFGCSPFRHLNICSPAFPAPSMPRAPAMTTAPRVHAHTCARVPDGCRTSRRRSTKRGSTMSPDVVRTKSPHKRKLSMLRPPSLQFAQPFSPSSPPSNCTAKRRQLAATSAFSPMRNR